MPSLPHSRAATRDRAVMPPLAAAYSPRPACPPSTARDPRLMIRPQPFSRIIGRTAPAPQPEPLPPPALPAHHRQDGAHRPPGALHARAPRHVELLVRDVLERAACAEAVRVVD